MIKKLIAVGLIVFIYNLFFFPGIIPSPGRLDFAVFLITMIAAAWIMFWPDKWVRKTKIALQFSALSLLIAIFSLFRASPVDQFFLGVESFFLLGISVYLLTLKTDNFGGLIEYILSPFRIGKHWLQAFTKKYFVGDEKIDKKYLKIPKSKNLSAVIRGIIFTIPIAFLIIGFLSSSDPIFSKFVTNAFKNLMPQKIIARTIHTLFIIGMLVPAFILEIKKQFTSPASHKIWQRFHIETTVMTTTVSLILATFLFIQFKYIFASVPETMLHQFGIQTYSEYVRRGFVEMLIVSGIVYTTLGIAYATIRAQKQKSYALNISNYVLISELILFIISILRRLYLYQLHHGLTRVRIYGLSFSIFIFGLSIFLLLRHLIPKNISWYRYELGLGFGLILITTILKPDYLISTIVPPTVNNQIDYVHISRLSSDALTGWVEAFEHDKEISLNLPELENISDDQVRQVLYAYQSSQNLTYRYSQLVALYGSQEEYDVLYPAQDMNYLYTKQSNRKNLLINLAEKSTYKKLIQQIPLQELSQVRTTLQKYINLLPDNKRFIPIDRSYESPLL